MLLLRLEVKMLLTSSELLVKRLLNAEYGNKWLQKLQEF